MSRLIDADALMADCQLAQKQADRHGREFANAFYSGGGEISTEWWCVEDMIENAPTIEERKTGKWIERNPQNSDKCRLIECDKCGFSHIVGFNVPYEHWIENRNFCERCGADMRGTLRSVKSD